MGEVNEKVDVVGWIGAIRTFPCNKFLLRLRVPWVGPYVLLIRHSPTLQVRMQYEIHFELITSNVYGRIAPQVSIPGPSPVLGTSNPMITSPSPTP
jgi:hypothetical protein